MTSVIQRNFAGGEISPALYARSDQVKYQTGLRTCRNFIVLRHGGAANRPGTEFICEVKDSSKTPRLAKFVFNDSQTYVLEFGDQYMRVIQNGVQLDSGGSPYEIATPYLEADLRALRFVQSADVITITHPSYATRQLTRTGHTSWTLATITFEPSIAAPTSLSGTAGATGSNTYSYKVSSLKADSYEESLPTSAYDITSAAEPTVLDPHTLTWTAEAEAELYYIYKADTQGIYGYIGYTDGTGFSDYGITPDASLTPPLARTPFSGADDYPSVSAYYQQRQLYANTNNDPEKVWASRSGDYHNLAIHAPLQSDDAVTWTIAANEVQEVRHMLEVGQLIILTAGGEWVIKGGSDGVLTPTAINPERQGYNGASTIPPVVIGNNVLYVQARGSIVRDLRYQLDVDGYAGNDLSIFSSHLFRGKQLLAMDYQQIPDSVLWAVRDDGTLLGLTYVPEHEVWGWHRHDTSGDFEDVVCVPEGEEDSAYVLVKRTINGTTKRYIERLASRNVTDITRDAFFVDSGLTYNGWHTGTTTMTLTGGTTWKYTEDLTLTASVSFFIAGDVGNAVVIEKRDTDGNVEESVTCTITAYTSGTEVTVNANKTVPADLRATAYTTWGLAADEMSGLDHLEGETVSLLVDGNVAPPETVSSGAFTLDRPAVVVHAGLPVTADLETLNVDNPTGETLQDKRLRVPSVSLFVESSRGIFAGPDANTLYEYKQREFEAWGEPTALKTGLVEVTIPTDWENNGRVFVRQSDPLPVTILAAIPSGEGG